LAANRPCSPAARRVSSSAPAGSTACGGKNFLLTIRRLLAERDSLRVVDDQTGSPTWSRLVAEATAQIIARGGKGLAGFSGIYHLTCQGSVTWYGFAREIAAHSRGAARPAAIVPVTSAEYGAAAVRPACAVLDNGKLAATFGLALPDWRAALALALGGGGRTTTKQPRNTG
jgi:dTDP-4-dehydrorhamnose reductase